MAAPVAEMFEHDGPWSEEDFLALPLDPRVELLDGALLVSPYARGSHQRMSANLAYALAVAAPDDLEILPTVNVHIGPGKILIPDLVVITEPGLDVLVHEAEIVAMVVEVSGPNNPGIDRAVKPALYAQAGIPHYLRVEMPAHGPVGFAYRLVDGRYAEVARSEPGRPLVLDAPIPAVLDLAALAAATRPPR